MSANAAQKSGGTQRGARRGARSSTGELKGSTRRAILSAALRVAAEHGITGASMDQIADVAGVSKGSLYYNFASKDALFEELLRGGLQELADELQVESHRDATGTAKLTALLTVTLTLLQQNPELAKLLVSELFRVDRSWGEMLGLLRQRIVAQFARTVEQIMRESQRTVDHPEIVGAGVFGSALVAGVDWLMFFPKLPQAAVVTSLLETAGLRG